MTDFHSKDKDEVAASLARGNSKVRRYNCRVCEEKVKETEKGICCDVCEYWHHTKCLNMSDTNYKVYRKDSIQWVCQTCIKAQKEANALYEMIIVMMKNAEEDKEKDREEREIMMMTLKKVSEQMSGLEKIIEEKINEKMKSSKIEILTKMNEEMEERLEKFKRRKNIIVYGMSEKEGGNEKERYENDCKNVKNLLKELEVVAKNYDVSRIGKFSKEGRARPIRIELSRECEKYEILKNAPKIRNTNNENFKRIILSTDMSFKQRQLEKLLREQMVERKQAGERNLVIRRGKIVKWGMSS